MTKPFCDCLGCAVGGECCATPAPVQTVPQPDAYLEARLTLIEEMFAQLLGGVPEKIAVQLSAMYNLKRRAIILQAYPHLKDELPVHPEPAEKSRIITPHH